jgi:hypothetical protein
VIRKKWWQKKAIEGSHQWCVIRVEEYVVFRTDVWEAIMKDVYKPCHITNLPRGSHLLNKNLTQHEAQGLCKLLNQGELK